MNATFEQQLHLLDLTAAVRQPAPPVTVTLADIQALASAQGTPLNADQAHLVQHQVMTQRTLPPATPQDLFPWPRPVTLVALHQEDRALHTALRGATVRVWEWVTLAGVSTAVALWGPGLGMAPLGAAAVGLSGALAALWQAQGQWRQRQAHRHRRALIRWSPSRTGDLRRWSRHPVTQAYLAAIAASGVPLLLQGDVAHLIAQREALETLRLHQVKWPMV
jgi:hypothetical protein